MILNSRIQSLARYHWHLHWTKVEFEVNLVRSWINKTVMYCFMHCLAFLLRQLKCMTRADAMRGSWWWIFDIIFSLKLMWDSQNDFIIIISGHVPVPLFSGPISALRNERIEPCRVLELSRGKSNHFPLSKIEVQAVRMILIIILILLITSYSSEKSQKHHFKTSVRLWKFMV